MKALILAAGLSPAAFPLTRECPAPMLRILGTPLLDIVIERLRGQGVTEIVIDTGRGDEAIEQYFGDGRRFGVEIAYACASQADQGQAAGSATALRRIHAQAGFFDETLLVLPGNTLIDIDLAALVAFHHRQGAMATVALAAEQAGAECFALIDEDGRITEFGDEAAHADTAALCDTGVYLLEPALLQYIPDVRAAGLASHVFPMLAEQGLPLYGLQVEGGADRLSNAGDYYRLCQQALRGELDGVALPGREIAPGVRVGLNVRIDLRRCRIEGPVVIAGGAVIEDGVTLVGPCYVGAGAVIERDAQVEASVVLPHSRVSGHAHLEAAISDGRYCITADGTVLDMRRAGLDWLIADARSSRRALAQAEQRFLDTFH